MTAPVAIALASAGAFLSGCETIVETAPHADGGGDGADIGSWPPSCPAASEYDADCSAVASVSIDPAFAGIYTSDSDIHPTCSRRSVSFTAAAIGTDGIPSDVTAQAEWLLDAPGVIDHGAENPWVFGSIDGPGATAVSACYCGLRSRWAGVNVSHCTGP